MTTEEFYYYNNGPIHTSQQQNFSLKNRWRLKDLTDYLGISIPALSKIETGCTDISFCRPEQIAGVYKTYRN
jgi:transcriptional regulator with XRE-family HTH domain